MGGRSPPSFLKQATMDTEVIAIGTELTSGQNLDTNSQWLSRRLAEIGIQVGWHTTIADDLGINVDAFRIASQSRPASDCHRRPRPNPGRLDPRSLGRGGRR